MGKGNGPTVAILAGLLIAGLMCIQAAANYLGSDARAIRDCRATHWTCEAQVAADPRLESVERSRPSFTAEARHCAEQKAFESAVHRAMFDCGMSPRAAQGSCAEVETVCELSGAG